MLSVCDLAEELSIDFYLSYIHQIQLRLATVQNYCAKMTVLKKCIYKTTAVPDFSFLLKFLCLLSGKVLKYKDDVHLQPVGPTIVFFMKFYSLNCHSCLHMGHNCW